MTSEHAFLFLQPRDFAGLEHVAFFTATWLRTVFACLALVWLSHRTLQVFTKPVDELVNLLGLEVPTAPEVSLAGIKADGVILHWKPPDHKSAVIKYEVHVNGISVGHVSHQETSAKVTGLKPDHFYIVRVVAISATNFQAASASVRVRTSPASSNDYFNNIPSAHDDELQPDDTVNEPPPRVQPYKAFLDLPQPPPTPPAMVREHSGSISQLRRSGAGRRPSPTDLCPDPQPTYAHEPGDAEGSIQHLTEKLDSLRRENDEIEKHLVEEEEEFQNTRESLTKERDDLKQMLKSREEATRELKRQVAQLERASATALAKRQNQEKALQQIQGQREKMGKDMLRWDSEIDGVRAELQQMKEEESSYADATEEKVQELRQRHVAEQQANKGLEEKIREVGVQIKVLEEQRKTQESSDIQEEHPDTVDPDDAEESREWGEKFTELRMRYSNATMAFQRAQQIHAELQLYVDHLRQRRASQSYMYGPPPNFDAPPIRTNSQRRRRTGSSLNDGGSTSAAGLTFTSGPAYNSSISSISPPFSTPSPFFNINNGMALPASSQQSGMHQSEVELLTAGAPMSPSTAGALLPSGLLGDDQDTDVANTSVDDAKGRSSGSPRDSPRDVKVLPGLGAIPGLGAPQTLEQANQGPSSPASVQSYSPSVFASPRDSTRDLSFHAYNADDANSDQQSIRSTTGSARAVSGGAVAGTRFRELFGGLGLNRPRGKTASDEGPAFGSLKPSQSRSVPRQDRPDPSTVDSQRRRGSHSGGWMTQLSSALTRNGGSSLKAGEDASHTSPKRTSSLMAALNSSRGVPWPTDRPLSPRPASLNSLESNILPRPSVDRQQRFRWPMDSLGARNSPLGNELGLTSTNSWSRRPSRRPSVSYGSTVSLGQCDMPILENDGQELLVSDVLPLQAPIGTRPHTLDTLKLNPAAPAFTTTTTIKNLFSRDKKADKAEKSVEKAKHKGKEKTAVPDTPPAELSATETSPPSHRKSKDAFSISTATESVSDSRESLERTTSHTPSESLTPSGTSASANRESFFQKIQRKSSASKFNMPGFGSKDKGSGGGLFSKSKAVEAATPDETDEDVAGASGLLSRSVDSVGGSPLVGGVKEKENRGGGLSWSSLKGKMRKGDKTPSINESMASETGDDEEELL